MVYGLAGRLLEVDLTHESISKTNHSEEVARKYLGGRGLGAWLLWEQLKPGTDAMSPEAPLMFLLGPLTGAWSSHTCVSFKSPETGTMGHAMTGGSWGPELKFAGYDGLIVTGRADKPVYICVKDDNVEIRPAQQMWGEGTTATTILVRKDLGDPLAKVLCCGPAGEKGVVLSSIVQDSWRAAARGGGGAVMGAKNLKAVAVRGTQGAHIADMETFNALADEFRRKLASLQTGVYGGYIRGRYGSMLSTVSKCDANDMAVKNFADITWNQTPNIGGVRLERRNVVGHASCYGCNGGCFHISVVRSGEYAGTVSQIDFDSTGLLGPNCLVSDPDAMMYLNALCDELGLDAESAGTTLSWVMECYEKGLLTSAELGGVELRWGDAPAMIQLIHNLVAREGFGDVLAKGLKHACGIVGKGSGKFAMHCKGMGLGGHHPVTPERGLQYAVGDRGGCHHYGNSVHEQNWRAWADSLTCCTWHFVAIGEDYSKMLSMVTGWDLQRIQEEWDTTAERLLILARAFNIREGMKPLLEDILPDRVHEEAFGGGKTRRSYPREQFEADRANWYAKRGCDATGIPTSERLRQLGLDFVDPVMDEFRT